MLLLYGQLSQLHPPDGAQLGLRNLENALKRSALITKNCATLVSRKKASRSVILLPQPPTFLLDPVSSNCCSRKVARHCISNQLFGQLIIGRGLCVHLCCVSGDTRVLVLIGVWGSATVPSLPRALVFIFIIVGLQIARQSVHKNGRA